MLCAFLLGFGDACYNTQVCSYLEMLIMWGGRAIEAVAAYYIFMKLTGWPLPQAAEMNCTRKYVYIH